jgi:hypothetical protein
MRRGISCHRAKINPPGVKGIGEIGIVGTAAAIAHAVYQAICSRRRDLPVTRDKLMRDRTPEIAALRGTGWGARTRTWEWRNQNPANSVVISTRILNFEPDSPRCSIKCLGIRSE